MGVGPTAEKRSPRQRARESSPPADRRGRPRRARSRTWRRIRGVVTAGWFEPILALLAVVIILGSLLLYTGTWPPLVVVESWSMEHGPNDPLGIINTGDIVLVKHVDAPAGVTTYVQGLVNGFQTYGEYGDVILYYPDGQTDLTPIIHRAMIWLQYNASEGAFNAPTLLPLTCGPNQQYVDLTGLGGTRCLNPGDPNAPLTGTLVLYHVGYNGVTVNIDLNALIQTSPWSGYITLGDNNSGLYDQLQCPPKCLVQPGWILGVARGLLPWFGDIKLWIDDQLGHDNNEYTRMVPTLSWVYLGISLALIVTLPQVVPWSYRKWRDRRRHRGSDPEEATDGDASPEDPETDGSGPPVEETNPHDDN